MKNFTRSHWSPVTYAISILFACDSLHLPLFYKVLHGGVDMRMLILLLSGRSPTDFNVLGPLFPGLFREDVSRAAPRLRSRLHEALSAMWPKGTPSELTYSPFWDIVGYGLPEFAGHFLNENFVQNRCD